MTLIPRPEYPRPQFVRVDAAGNPDWLCLNGEWEFEIDAGDSGLDRGLRTQEEPYAARITVPFCPESDLSGIGHKDFMNAVWYRRRVTIPAAWSGKAALLHFQAVDYDATVWAITPKTDEKPVEIGRHRGGFTPFSCSLEKIADAGDEITIILRARDPGRNAAQPRGKQAVQYAPHSCFYTRTTGIWQTVWMEPVSVPAALKRPRITPDVGAGVFRLELPLTNNPKGCKVRARLKDDNGVIAEAEVRADFDLAPRLDLPVPYDRRRLWGPKDPFLYDIEIELVNAANETVDRVQSYAGLRSVGVDGKKVRINGESVFQRLVLDQGYYPDGVMTAPTDEALIRDIQLSLEAGFNGARLHQKVFEERFLYHADRMGYLCWGEFADWGSSNYGPTHDHQQPGITYAAQWLEALERDYSHPSIIGWCPLNETWQQWHDRITTLDDATRALFLAAKAMDTTRPVLDTSGYAHRVLETDVYDSHDYIENKDFDEGLELFRQRHAGNPEWEPYLNPRKTSVTVSASGATSPAQTWSVPYRGQPYWVSEFGGFKWNPAIAAKSAAENTLNRKTSWGYGSDPTDMEDFYRRFEATCHILLDNVYMFGYCYTQLTDVYPEENGIYYFDRSSKFDSARLRAIQERIAAIEQEGE
jgi:beta-galactosidase/beta-glucuronidase